MRRKIITMSIMILLIILGFELLSESKEILEIIDFSFEIWAKNIFPSLFPFFVLSELLIHYGFVELVGELFRPIMQRLFKIKGKTAFIFIMSIISGFPSNAKFAKKLYENGTINKNEVSKILMFTHFSNPLFIFGTVSILFLNNYEVGILILIVHYLSNIIIGILIRNFSPSEPEYEKVSIKRSFKMMHEKRLSNEKNFGSALSSAITSSMSTLILILGVITTFLILTKLIDLHININNYNQSILNGFIEMTQGLKYISILDIPLKLKTVLSTMILSFGGFCVHVQILSILNDTNIKYLPYLTARTFHALISGVIVFFLFDIFIIYI